MKALNQYVNYKTTYAEQIASNLKGISKKRLELFHKVTGIDKLDILMLSVLYEYACTSILYKTKNKGIILLRNLDFGDFTSQSMLKELKTPIYKLLSKLAIQVSHQKNGKEYLVGVGAFGFIAYLNGYAPKQFSFSLNRRRDNDLERKFKFLAAGYWDPPMYMLETVYTSKDYSTAFDKLSDEKFLLADKVYYIIGGMKDDEGAIIQREKDNKRAVYS